MSVRCPSLYSRLHRRTPLSADGRGTDEPEVIECRIAKAEYEMTFAPQFDRVIVNDDLEAAKAETLKVIKEFLNKE